MLRLAQLILVLQLSNQGSMGILSFTFYFVIRYSLFVIPYSLYAVPFISIKICGLGKSATATVVLQGPEAMKKEL